MSLVRLKQIQSMFCVHAKESLSKLEIAEANEYLKIAWNLSGRSGGETKVSYRSDVSSSIPDSAFSDFSDAWLTTELCLLAIESL